MSAINGDKSRFNRERKQKIARRVRTRLLVKSLAARLTTAVPPTQPRGKEVSA